MTSTVYNNVTGLKISEFNVSSSIGDGDLLPFVSNGQNLAIPFSGLKSSLGVTGQIKSEGSGVSILSQPTSFINYIASIKSGKGVSVTKANGDITISANIANGAGGESIIKSLTASQTVYKSLKAGTNVTITDNDDNLEISAEDVSSANAQIVVKKAADLSGSLRSDVIYLIDGSIDMGTTSISVPSGGLNISGYNFNVSKLTSAAKNYTMFTGGTSGNLLVSNVAIEVTGTNSRVYNLIAATGFEAVELTGVNYGDCTSLGTLDGFRQGLEMNTGRFGGRPNLTLDGAWGGGFLLDTVIARNIGATTDPLFIAGDNFVMQSRFKANMNFDLGVTAALFDFAPANFPNDLTLQLQGALITRDGVISPSDTTIYPNITEADDSSDWRDNVGLPNTNPSALLTITTEAETTVTVAGDFYDIAGTFTLTKAIHFDQPLNNQARYDVSGFSRFLVTATVTIDGTSGDEVTVQVVKYELDTDSTSVVSSKTEIIPTFTGPNDIANFTIIDTVNMSNGDYLFLQVANTSSTNNVTAKLDSKLLLSRL